MIRWIIGAIIILGPLAIIVIAIVATVINNL
jgi:hypothetical protein